MVRSNPSAQPLAKGKGKVTAPAKRKTSSSAVPPKKLNHGEATSSIQSAGRQAVAAIVASQPRAHSGCECGIKSVPPLSKKWYKSFCPNNMHLNLAVEEHRLKSKHPNIWHSLHDLGLSYVFKDPSDINVSLDREFYVGWYP